ncbi:MAG: 4Fe-4S binding protein [Desulfobacterales bacterium]
MHIETATTIFFSPTGTTAKIIDAIVRGLGFAEGDRFDLTLPDSVRGDAEIRGEALALIGAPVYAGRIPPAAAARLRRIDAGGAPAVLVVVYGNRAYDDALLELRDIALEMGFKPIAGAAFIGEHSYSHPDLPIAPGRPDAQDVIDADRFARSILKKLDRLRSPEDLGPLAVPGNFPYRERTVMNAAPPETLEESCTLCGSCAEVCPTAAITVGEQVATDPEACIFCCACVKICPEAARRVRDPELLEIRQRLNQNCRERRKPEWFL